MLDHHNTIAAVATPSGRGGIGILRISGVHVKAIAKKILGKIPESRKATFATFKNQHNEIIDEGIALLFLAPHSFTGEDVLELQGHGGVHVLNNVLQAVLDFGARLAEPGEFSKRAFLNNKMDLIQAEAIADLIDATSTQAALSAVKSLQGEFSKKINVLVEDLIQLRLNVEANIDFPEEDIDHLQEQKIFNDLKNISNSLEKIQSTAKQGALLKEGISLVIVGKPNAGKSSLLNCLSERDVAIVTDIAGTTRDVLREHIQIDGLPIHIIDTAGLHQSDDVIEQEGQRRAREEIKKADMILLLIDGTSFDEKELAQYFPEEIVNFPNIKNIIIVKNKIDLLKELPEEKNIEGYCVIGVSVKFEKGIDLLKEKIKFLAGFYLSEETIFIARKRHLEAIKKAKEYLNESELLLKQHQLIELIAEHLRLTQDCLSEITGKFGSDDLLGRIFSEFCIGK